MKQDKWTQQLHDKLADYQTDAPEGLWDDIEAALQTQAKPQEARFISLRQWIIAACLASFLATGGYMWYHSANESESNQNATELADAKKDIIQDNPVESDNDLLRNSATGCGMDCPVTVVCRWARNLALILSSRW